jgi:hypothetical protein
MPSGPARQAWRKPPKIQGDERTKMVTRAEHQKPRDFTVREVFDEALGLHMERLIGARYGIGGLPVNLTTISCLILLTEQVTNEMDSLSASSERYTQSTLLGELSELGFGPEEDSIGILQDMILKGYIRVEENGGFSVQKPTISMAQLFDRTFPKMPGMNLVAFLVQIIDEVRSGRKALQSALSQFDQTLKTQGIPLRGEGIPLDTQGPSTKSSREKRESPEIKAPPETAREIGPGKRFKLTDIMDSRRSPLRRTHLPPVPHSDEEAPSPEAAKETPEILKAGTGDIPGGEDPSRDTSLESERTSTDPDGSPPLSEPPERETGPSEHLGTPGPRVVLSTEEEPLPASLSEDRIGPIWEGDSSDSADESIDSRIAAFEEDLAMKCPICESGRIESNKTSTAKIYYRCLNRECNFISWGRPYHIECPRCHNPFLVEITLEEGKNILKCPRATCRHRQEHPCDVPDESVRTGGSSSQISTKTASGPKRPKRRVVRRRVVRRKR